MRLLPRHLSASGYEKLWRSFYVGAVPIVYGSSKSKDVYPTNRSAIEILDFQSPKELADYLNFLNQNDEEYNKYLSFKRKNGVTNQLLLDLMQNRKWGINNDRIRGSYIDHFECLVCSRLHENMKRKARGESVKIYQANKDHYGCPIPYTFSSDGILLDEKFRGKSEWKESLFLTSYEWAYVQQKIFFDEFYSKNNFNLTYKILRKKTLDKYNEFIRNNKSFNKNDL